MTGDFLFELPTNNTEAAQCYAREGLKYAGSKLRLLQPILDISSKVEFQSVFDAFSGTTRVSRLFAALGKDVTSNDISDWSTTIAKAYFYSDSRKESTYRELLDYLNSLSGFEGWFTETYGGDPNADTPVRRDGKKAVWQHHNTMRLDAIRDEIDRLTLTEDEKAVALTSLIYALDTVDSTIGHYAAYLKEWSPRSYKDLKLRLPYLISLNGRNKVLQGDVFSSVQKLPSAGVDLAYLDPPYGSNNEKMPPSRVRYASYYHIWKTVILNDHPATFGAANRREDSRDNLAGSVFEEYRKDAQGNFVALSAIADLISSLNSRHLLLSYSSGGRATFKSLVDLLHTFGKLVTVAEIEYRRNVMANMRWTNDWVNLHEGKNIEYLFLVSRD